MSLKYSILLGLLMWVLMFAIVSALMAIGLAEWNYLWILTTIIAGVVGFMLAKWAKPKKLIYGILYGLIWIVIGVILDAIVTRYFNPEILYDWKLWVGYSIFFIGVVIGSLISSMKAQGLDKKPTKKPKDIEPAEEIGEGGPASPMR